MAIFNSYVKLPEGSQHQSKSLDSFRKWSHHPIPGTWWLDPYRCRNGSFMGHCKRNVIIWLVYLPLWKIWVRQWVSDDIPYMKWENNPFMFEPPSSYACEHPYHQDPSRSCKLHINWHGGWQSSYTSIPPDLSDLIWWGSPTSDHARPGLRPGERREESIWSTFPQILWSLISM